MRLDSGIKRAEKKTNLYSHLPKLISPRGGRPFLPPTFFTNVLLQKLRFKWPIFGSIASIILAVHMKYFRCLRAKSSSFPCSWEKIPLEFPGTLHSSRLKEAAEQNVENAIGKFDSVPLFLLGILLPLSPSIIWRQRGAFFAHFLDFLHILTREKGTEGDFWRG